MKTFTLEADGSLSVVDDNGGKLNTDGSPALTAWTIHADQVAAHRRDAPFVTALQGSTLTPAQKIALAALK